MNLKPEAAIGLGAISPVGDTSSLGQHGRKLARSVFSGAIAAALREEIIGGTLEAGAPLVESRLAEQMNVSRGPVRSALHALEGEGLARTLPNGRMVAAGFGEKDSEDLLAVRLVIESTALRWAGERGFEPSPVVEALEAMRAEETSTPGLADLDLGFHSALVALSKSRFLMQSWSALAPVLHAVITLGNRALAERDPDSNFRRIIASHEAVVAALLSKDLEVAIAKLAEQFEITGSMLPGISDAAD